LGNAIYFPYLAVVVILAAIWLAWQGLIRKRATRTIEGTVWMVVACAAAIFLIGKPADVTGVGRGVSDGISQALNAAFAKLPSPGPTSCVPVQNSDPQVKPATYSYTSGGTVVDQNADELWTVLVCKPWLVGEFGTSVFSSDGGKASAVSTYGRSLLWAQAIAVNEKPTPALVQAKQDAFAGIASSIQTNDPAIYPLFQGKQWTTRLEVAFAALFAAVVAGVLVLLIAVTLILLKLSFLLLLIVGPFFLLIGVHPGFGRVVALRWVEMLIGVLLKQAAVALVLSVLLYCYALIMGTSDAVLPWALKILMIALVTVAAFIYRKPFQHLFSAVGYGVVGSQDRAEADLARAGAAARANTFAAATIALPGIAAYRAGRWARHNPGQAASLAMAATSGGAAAVAAGLQAGDSAGSAEGSVDADGMPVAAAGAGGQEGAGGRMALLARARSGAVSAGSAVSAEPPPLNLPSRNGSGPATATDAARSANGSAGVSALASSAARAAAGSAGQGATAQSADRGSARGAWPAGRGVSGASRESLRQPGGPPPRQTGPPPVRSSPAGSAPAGSAPVRPASSQPSRSQPTGSEPARVQQPTSQRPPSQRAQARAQAPEQRAPSRAGQPQRGASQRTQSQQPARQQALPPQQARGQSPAGGRLRMRRPAASAPARPSSSGQSQPSSARSRRPEADQQQSSSAAERTSWQGQAMTGPLARPSAEPDRQVPFWLRPMRRK
jgi:TrbL/VirB6 plasmid conjugal transfer protein